MVRLRPYLVKLRLNNLRIASRADAVAKFNFRMLADVAFNSMPVVLLITNFLTVRTDGEQTLKLLNLRKSGFEFAHTCGETSL